MASKKTKKKQCKCSTKCTCPRCPRHCAPTCKCGCQKGGVRDKSRMRRGPGKDETDRLALSLSAMKVSEQRRSPPPKDDDGVPPPPVPTLLWVGQSRKKKKKKKRQAGPAKDAYWRYTAPDGTRKTKKIPRRGMRGKKWWHNRGPLGWGTKDRRKKRSWRKKRSRRRRRKKRRRRRQ